MAVILAAGKGERLGGRKPLARLAGVTLLQHVAGAFMAAGVARLVVVTGAYHDEVAAHALSLGMEVTHNARFEEGMLASVRAGLEAAGEAAAVLLHPVDTPLLRPATIGVLLRAWRAAPQPERLLSPCHQSQPGHPPLLGRRHVQAVRQWRGAQGLGGYIEQATGVEQINVEDAGILLDVDTPQDLHRAQALALSKAGREGGGHASHIA